MQVPFVQKATPGLLHQIHKTSGLPSGLTLGKPGQACADCLLFALCRNILHEIRKLKANWIGHILRGNCLLKQVIERKIKGEMEVTRRRGRRRRKLLDDLKNRRGCSHLKEEALDRTMWRNRFGGGFEPIVRQSTE